MTEITEDDLWAVASDMYQYSELYLGDNGVLRDQTDIHEALKYALGKLAERKQADAMLKEISK